MLHASRVKLFAEASELFTYAVFQLVIICKMESSECILQWAKKMKVRGCYIGTVGRMKENNLYPIVVMAFIVCSLVCSGVVMQEEDLIHLSVGLNPSNSLL
jgi:hypothetical protein